MSRKEVYYKDYLQLDKILGAQELESEKAGVEGHDEMLFIVTHQAYELWFKQVLYELNSILDLLARPAINDNEPTMQTVVRRGGRIIRILRLLVDQITILETMTSLDFLDFRDLLRPASGFQSIQWKELEAKLGLHFDDRHGREYYVSQLRPEDVERVKARERDPNLLDLVNLWLERMPYFEPTFWPGARPDVPIQEHPFWKAYREAYKSTLLDIEAGNMDLFDRTLFGIDDDPKRRLSPKASRAALFIMLYSGYPILHMPAELLVALQDIDEMMATWRTRHINMVSRMIGTRAGTGKSTGRSYLKGALDKHYIFTEITLLNGLQLPRRDLPVLDDALKAKLGFGR